MEEIIRLAIGFSSSFIFPYYSTTFRAFLLVNAYEN
jgi:hypothetical protein